MNFIYDDAKDKNVAAVVIYGKAADTKAYVDEACTIQFKTSELKEAFVKRAVVMIGGNCFTPVSFTVSSNVGTVKYAKANATTATSADLGSLEAVAD